MPWPTATPDPRRTAATILRSIELRGGAVGGAYAHKPCGKLIKVGSCRWEKNCPASRSWPTTKASLSVGYKHRRGQGGSRL